MNKQGHDKNDQETSFGEHLSDVNFECLVWIICQHGDGGVYVLSRCQPPGGREKFFFFVFWLNFWLFTLQNGSRHMTFGFFHYVTVIEGEQTHERGTQSANTLDANVSARICVSVTLQLKGSRLN